MNASYSDLPGLFMHFLLLQARIAAARTLDLFLAAGCHLLANAGAVWTIHHPEAGKCGLVCLAQARHIHLQIDAVEQRA